MRTLVDNSRWPLSVQRLGSDMTDGEYDVFLATIRQQLERRERYAFVLHLDTLSMDAIRRRKMAILLKENDAEIRHYCLGGAIITRTRVSAALVTAVRWIVSPPHPERVFSDSQSAYAFAGELLASAGLRAGPALELVRGAPRSAGVHTAL